MITNLLQSSSIMRNYSGYSGWDEAKLTATWRRRKRKHYFWHISNFKAHISVLQGKEAKGKCWSSLKVGGDHSVTGTVGVTCVKYCLYCFVQGLRSFLTREQKQILKQPNLTVTRVFIVMRVIFSVWEIDQNKTIIGSHNSCFEDDLLRISVNGHCWLKYKF